MDRTVQLHATLVQGDCEKGLYFSSIISNLLVTYLSLIIDLLFIRCALPLDKLALKVNLINTIHTLDDFPQCT